MRVKTRLFEMGYSMKTISQIGGVSLTQVYRYRSGKRKISGLFIVNIMSAFPKKKFEDLFYIEGLDKPNKM